MRRYNWREEKQSVLVSQTDYLNSDIYKKEKKSFYCTFKLPFLLAGAGKDAPIVTPLMDFVRQKRASKAGSRVLL